MNAATAQSAVPAPVAPTAADVHCFHCVQPVPAGLVRAGDEHQFCCAGCRAVYETIHACGLDPYYRLRASADAAFAPAAPSADTYAPFDQEAFETLYAVRGEGGAKSVDLVLEGVTCAACVWLVERLPKVLDGVLEARLSLREATVRVTWDPTRVALSRVARTLDTFGYTPHPAKGQSRKELLRRDERRRLVRLGVAGALMGNTMLLALALYAGLAEGMEAQFRTFFRWTSAILGTVSLVWPGAVFFTSAYAALRTRTINLDVPIALALVVGGVAGAVNVVLDRGEIYFDSLTVLVFLLLVGRWMQYLQQRRADDAVELLFSMTPSTCHLVDEAGSTTDVPVEVLKAGDLVDVRSGELIPADGRIVAGRSAVNQALLTGESVPAEVGPGSDVCAGAQNAGSVLRVRVDRVGQETRVGQLMRLVERGVAEKPAIVRFADRVGAWFVVAVSVAAAGTFAYWAQFSLSAAIDHTVALLIVTCPCVLGLATPLTLGIAIGRLAQQDVLVKSAAALERLSRSGRLLLDKTGTLTEGRLELIGWHGAPDPGLRAAVAAAERQSTHPVAKALAAALADADAAAAVDVEVLDVTERHDGGIAARLGDGRTLYVGSPAFVSARGPIPPALDRAREEYEAAGATVVLVADGHHVAALAALRDRVRDDSRRAVARLAALGWEPSILSGDARPVVAAVAAQVEIDPGRAHGHVAPEEKLAVVNRRDAAAAERGGVTVMIGDGVNDAAALAAADVGIAVHGGAEASLAAADVYVARPGLAPVVALVTTARHAMRVIRRNLLVSLAYNVLAGVLAATGVMTPLIAAIIMPVSSASVLSLAVLSVTSRKFGGQNGDPSWK
jgi:Cu2+-exporting ATPase